MKTISLAIITSLFLTGCVNSLLPRTVDSTLNPQGVSFAGVDQIFPIDGFEPVDLPTELDPAGNRYDLMMSSLSNRRNAINELRTGQQQSQRSRAEMVLSEILEGGPNMSAEARQTELAYAFRAFYTYAPEEVASASSGNDAANEAAAAETLDAFLSQRRNRVQDRILAAANQRCHVYQTHLMRTTSNANFLLGSLATTVGGAGAIFTAPGTSRALSGTASILSGVRAEYNQDYLYNQTVDVIVGGIELRRQRIRREIEVRRGSPSYSRETNDLGTGEAVSGEVSSTATTNGTTENASAQPGATTRLEFNPFTRSYFELEGPPDAETSTGSEPGATPIRGISIDYYSVEMAVADALRYHSACSLVAGLDEAEQAIQMVDNPGLGSVNSFLQGLNDTQGLIRQLADDG